MPRRSDGRDGLRGRVDVYKREKMIAQYLARRPAKVRGMTKPQWVAYRVWVRQFAGKVMGLEHDANAIRPAHIEAARGHAAQVHVEQTATDRGVLADVEQSLPCRP